LAFSGPANEGTGIDSAEKFCGLLGSKEAIRGIGLIGKNGLRALLPARIGNHIWFTPKMKLNQADLSANPPFRQCLVRFASSGLRMGERLLMFHRITDGSMVQNDFAKKSHAPAKLKAILNLTGIWCMGVAETRDKPFGTGSG
jgi:hypothetical protein